MGDDKYQGVAADHATPVHDVALTRPFYLSDREVTVAQFLEFINDSKTLASEKPNSGKFSTDHVSPTEQHPIQWVNWYDTILYCNWLSRREGRTPCYENSGEDWTWISTATGYRLPTEAEWEYACRAGTTTQYGFGEDDSLLPAYAVFHSSHAERCGSKLPNAWGLFDMHGNVNEWCWDWKGPYSIEPVNDPIGIDKATHRVYRSGSWFNDSFSCRSAFRSIGTPEARFYYYGFRVATFQVR